MAKQVPYPGATVPAKALKAGRRVKSSTAAQLAALGFDELPYVSPLSEEEAHLALERDLLLKVGKHLQVSDYPYEARRWRWTGTVLVEVLVAGNGLVKQVALSRTSGFRVLDMQALEVVRRVPKLYMPLGLRQRDRTVTVPVGFYLQKL
jgi:TonB family protein